MVVNGLQVNCLLRASLTENLREVKACGGIWWIL